MPYFFWTLVPPPSGTLPPLIMAWPPMLLGFDEDYGTACFACDDRGGKSCRSGADHNDIGLAAPVNRVLPCGRARYGSAQRSRHYPAPLPTMICPSARLPSTAKIVAQKLAKRRAGARSVTMFPAPVRALCCTLQPQLAIHARMAATAAARSGEVRYALLQPRFDRTQGTCQAVQSVSVQPADLCSKARQWVGSVGSGRSRGPDQSAELTKPDLGGG
jgi:hypothetical protein